jgi:hypothetical protein
MFSVVCDKDIKPESIKPGEKIYLDTSHFLPFSRFIQKKGEKGPNKGGNKNQKGKGGNFNRGGKGGKGRGGPQRGSGGYRPPRGGSSGGYRPPRKQGK